MPVELNQDPATLPHFFTGLNDTFAFNSLAVMGFVLGFHAGMKRIFVPEKDLAFIAFHSDPGKALIAEGWTFYGIELDCCLRVPVQSGTDH